MMPRSTQQASAGLMARVSTALLAILCAMPLHLLRCSALPLMLVKKRNNATHKHAPMMHTSATCASQLHVLLWHGFKETAGVHQQPT